MSWKSLLPLLLVLAALVAAAAVDRAAKARRSGGECGDFWATVVKRTSWIGLLVWFSTIAQSFDTFWQSGWHLHLDRVLGFWWAFPAALLIPFAVWGAILSIGLVSAPTGREKGDWLAGSVGFTMSRRWVLLCTVPLSIPLIWIGRVRLGLGSEGYPAATWSTLVVLVISLYWVARSAGVATPVPVQRTNPVPVQPSVPLESWPEVMAAQGIQLEHVVSFSQGGTPRQVESTASDFAERLRVIGAQGLAPEVIESIHCLISPKVGDTGKPGYSLLFAPDESGQVEAVALAAGEISAAFQECSLIITPRPDVTLERRLERWLPESVHQPKAKVLRIGAETDLTETAGVWLVDAATLSDDFIVRLVDPAVVTRIGMVVWWDIHQYTGVLAANVWAISRRLHRLICGKGRPDVRILVLARDSFHAGAHMSSFVRRLLPYPFSIEHEVHVKRGFPRPLHLHVLRGNREYFQRNPLMMPDRLRHPALVAAFVSASKGWPTCLNPIAEIPEPERKEALDKWVGTAPLSEVLREEAPESGARIAHVGEADALALPEILGQGGRAAPPQLPHHVALTLADNPYVEYVVMRLKDGQDVQAARRLMGAEGHPAIFRRHLLLALSEQEDTRTRLKETLLWQEEVVEQTLQEIAGQGKLTRRRVPFVSGGERKIEYLYKSSLARNPERRPLDTVEDDTILVRVETEPGVVPMRVDRSRLAIRAYPGRVFVANGIRYRMRDWSSEARGWVACQREDVHATTWRQRTSKVTRMEKSGDERTTSQQGCLMKQYPVRLHYQEDVVGYIRREYDLTQGVSSDKPQHSGALMTEFDTAGLVLQFSPEPDLSALLGLCQALRHVLPVHLGVEEDAMEVVPLEGDYVGRKSVFGLVIVDLFPQGIGLVEAVCDDPLLVPGILRWTRDWLLDVAAKVQSGQVHPFHSPLAKAATGGGEDPQPALDLLRRVVGVEQRPTKSRPPGGG